MRRFCSRSAGVALPFNGSASPRPSATMREGSPSACSDQRPGGLRPRRGELEVRRETARVDRLIVGVADHLDRSRLALQRVADALEQRREARLDRGAARGEHAAVADAHDRVGWCADHRDQTLVDLRASGRCRACRPRPAAGAGGGRRRLHRGDARDLRHVRRGGVEHARKQIVGGRVERRREPHEQHADQRQPDADGNPNRKRRRGSRDRRPRCPASAATGRARPPAAGAR